MSTRYGAKNKMLHDMGGQGMLAQVLERIGGIGLSQIVVVTGHEKELIEQVAAPFSGVSVIHNPKFASGMSTSISVGVASVTDADAVFICLGDMPFLQSNDYKQLAKFVIDLDGMSSRIVVPAYLGMPGHPVVFGSDFFEELIQLPVQDQGAKVVIRSHPRKVSHYEVHHDRILKDLDEK